MTLREACLYGQKKLEAAGVPEALLDAWYLLEFVTGCKRSHYLAYPEELLLEEQEECYRKLTEKRAERIPLQQLTGEQEFMGLSFLVNEHVLIPRQDTEILVEEALSLLHPGMRFLDLCTGTGCILLSLMHSCPGAEGWGSDLSAEALKVADSNRKRLAPEARLIQSDLFEHIEGDFELIVSNPPYIKSSVIPELMEEVRLHEPVLALDGHEDGLYFYRQITGESCRYLKKDGWLLFEIGCDQGAEVSSILESQGFCDIEVIQDLAGLDRVVKGRYPG